MHRYYAFFFLLILFYPAVIFACTIDSDCPSEGGYAGKCIDGSCTVSLGIEITKPTNQQSGQPAINFKNQVEIPGYSFDTNDHSTGNLARYVKAIYNWGINIVGIVAAVAMVVGGAIWITSGGNASKVGEARAWIGSALTGLVLALMSYGLFNTINPDLVNFKTSAIKQVEKESICGVGNHLEMSVEHDDDGQGNLITIDVCKCVEGEGTDSCVQGQKQNCLEGNYPCGTSVYETSDSRFKSVDGAVYACCAQCCGSGCWGKFVSNQAGGGTYHYYCN